MLFRKKKPDPIMTYPYGFSPDTQPTTTLSQRALVCLIKGLIIYAATMGTIGGVITSFSLPCHLGVIALGLFIMAIALSFIHFNRWIFNLCYPILFFIFAFCIVNFRYHVNSGFQAFLSIMQEEYSTHFALEILRQAQETITDRTLTITYAALFIGFFLSILLNIAISEYMSVISVILLTFPIFQLGIYIDLMPDMVYLILLLASYFMTGTLRRSEHFLLPYRDKEYTEFKYTNKQGINVHKYHASGRIMAQMIATFFLFTLAVSIISFPMLLSSHASSQVSDARKTADKYVENLTQGGLSSFFNRYQATGGISEGKLGGVSAVRPDFETDLTITFVPFAYETLYLKAFTGGEYDGDRWLRPTYDLDTAKTNLGDKFAAFSDFTCFLEAKRLQHYTDTHKDSGISAKMKIENIDANTNCLYLPYYTNSEISTAYETNQSIVSGYVLTGESYTVNYSPLLHDYWPVNQTPDELTEYYGENHIYTKYIREYDTFCQENYISVPNDLNNYLQTLHDDIGFGVSTDEQIVMIQKYLENNYKYDMQPGTTPYRQDFVQYFLETQKRGYCAHFASAATMLLRSYDIPARYVEGYAVSFAEMSEGTNLDENYDEWFTGDNPIGRSGVISVDVPDASAHAWVEVYKPGIGWVPYEFTPPSDETSDSSDTYYDFWSVFSSLMSSPDTSNETNGNNNIEFDSSRRTITRIGSDFLQPFFQFTAVLIFVFCMIILIRKLHAIWTLHRLYNRKNYAPLLAYHYQKITAKLKKRGFIDTCVLLPTQLSAINEQLRNIVKHPEKLPPGDQIDRQMDVLEACCYGQTAIAQNEADKLLAFLKAYEKSMG